MKYVDTIPFFYYIDTMNGVHNPLLRMVEMTKVICMAPSTADTLRGTAIIDLHQFEALKAAYIDYLEASRKEAWVLTTVGK